MDRQRSEFPFHLNCMSLDHVNTWRYWKCHKKLLPYFRRLYTRKYNSDYYILFLPIGYHLILHTKPLNLMRLFHFPVAIFVLSILNLNKLPLHYLPVLYYQKMEEIFQKGNTSSPPSFTNMCINFLSFVHSLLRLDVQLINLIFFSVCL